MKKMKASEIARLVGGTFEGGEDPEITGVAPLDRATSSELSFVAHAKYAAYLDQTGAGVVLVSDTLVPRGSSKLPRIVVQDVYRALADVLRRVYPEAQTPAGVHATAVLEQGVTLEPGVSIGAYAVIGARTRIGRGTRIGAHCVIGVDCELGPEVVLYPQVSVYSKVRIGARCIVHSGARLGSDGFGYVFTDGQHRKIPQVGGLIIGDDVEIGANAAIDRGSVGTTEIGNGVKIDNLVHIGHNVRIGDLSIIVAQVGISGSTVVGKGATLAGQAGLVGHLKIGDGATIGAQAGVIGDVPAGAVYSGYPARPHKEAMRAQGALFKLPQIIKRLRAIERTLGIKSADE